MEVQFYILGLLIRYGPQHGYRLKQIVKTQISDFTQIKLPNIYYHLDKMNKDGYVTAETDKDGNRPEKTVYSITDKGKQYFNELMKVMLKEDTRLTFPLDGAIFFRERTNDSEFFNALDDAIQTYQQKLEALLHHRDETIKIIPSIARKETDAIFNHHIRHMKAELEWLQETKKGLSD